KTQSALLEGMQEGAVTVGGVSRPLPAPFFVLATQNPIEMEGTYPLPEAQLDRFLFKLRVRYPAIDELNAIIDRTTRSQQVTVSRVMSGPTVLSFRELIREVPIASHVRDFASTIVMATHPSWASSPEVTRRFVRYGASAHGAQPLLLGGKVRARADGRGRGTMAAPQAVEGLVRRVARQVGVRRAEHWGLRGAFWGALLAAAVLAFKAVLGLAALVLAPAIVLLGALAGAAYGLARRVAPRDAARLADRAFGLADRVATALEWADHPDRTPLVDALVADTVARVLALEPRQIVRRVIPLEGRWLPAPLLAGLVLALAPAIHLPTGRILDFTPSAEQEQHEERASTEMTAERSRPLPRDPLKRPSFEERDFAQRTGTEIGRAHV